MKFNTKVIHSGQNNDPLTGAVMPPIYQTSTFAQIPGVLQDYEYARLHNPTRTALETLIMGLEGGNGCVCFASGCAAADAILKSLSPGDHVIASDNLYGGIYRLFTSTFARYGIKFDFVDMSNPEQLSDFFHPSTRMVWIETPTNPLLKLCDISVIGRMAKEKKCVVVVDNTFASPYLQQPLQLGADMVLHSTTKYLGGHSDCIGGAVVTLSKKHLEHLKFQIKTTGAAPGPMDCYLILRGIKTLHVRMQKAMENAFLLSQFLESHPQVENVLYPGLASHKQYQLFKKQMKGPGAIVSFYLSESDSNAVKVLLRSTKIFTLAESLGGVESLITHPITMTHASLPSSLLCKLGITHNLIRLSVGIEDIRDLREDIAYALDKVSSIAK